MRIDPVGLGQTALCACKVAHTFWVEQRMGDAGSGQCFAQRLLITARRFQTHADRFADGSERLHQRFKPLQRTGHPPMAGRQVDIQEIRTADIGSPDPARENLILTGDQNIIDLAYSVRWNIKDPQQYLFQIADPENTIREVAESAMRAALTPPAIVKDPPATKSPFGSAIRAWT